MIIKLTWFQLNELKERLRALQASVECPKGELMDSQGEKLVEWDENEVKLTLKEK